MRTFTRVCFNDASFGNTQFDYLHWPSPAIREYDAKLLLAYWLARAPAVDSNATVKTKFVYPQAKVAQISWDPVTNTITPDTQLPGWVFNTKLVAKPDQLIKRRGKAGLLALNKTWDEAREWIAQRAGKPQQVSDRFLLRWRRSFFFFFAGGFHHTIPENLSPNLIALYYAALCVGVGPHDVSSPESDARVAIAIQSQAKGACRLRRRRCPEHNLLCVCL